MIQRIQTVYFLIAAILAGITLFGSELFSFSQDNLVVGTAYELTRGGEYSAKTEFWMLSLIQVLFNLMIIFSFKQRPRQIFLGWIVALLNILTTVWFVLGLNVYSAQCTTCKAAVSNASFGIAFYLHAIAFVFVLLGVFAVRKDKKTIDSLNRLR